MRIELINTGSELMLGFTVNTHPALIARALLEHGWRVDRQVAVADDRAELRAAVADSLQRADLLILTGGLGPTSDDFTRDVVAELLGRKLVRDETVAAAITERVRRRGLRLLESLMVQALVPEGGQVLPNRNGTAPGLTLEHDGRLVILLPGPPRELRPMFQDQVLPLLHQRYGKPPRLECRVFKVVGLSESAVEEKVAPALREFAGLELGYCARAGEIEVRIVTADQSLADRAEQRIREVLAENVYGIAEDRLEETVVKMLTAARRTIATAESCTGGLIASRLTNVSGSSAVFLNGWVTYSNESKQRDLGVTADALAKFGAVSEEVARQMAEGARARSGADLALSATGIAGPTGGTDEKPVGLVYLALATPHGTEVQRRLLAFDRETFKFFASQSALDLLRRELLRPSR